MVVTCAVIGAAKAPGISGATAGRLLVSDALATCIVTVIPAPALFSGRLGSMMANRPMRHAFEFGALVPRSRIPERTFAPAAGSGTVTMSCASCWPTLMFGINYLMGSVIVLTGYLLAESPSA